MKTYHFHIKRTHKDAWEPFQIDAPNSAAAVANLPLCVDWNFRTDNGKSMTTPVGERRELRELSEEEQALLGAPRNITADGVSVSIPLSGERKREFEATQHLRDELKAKNRADAEARAVPTTYVQTVMVVDPATGLETELEVRKLGTGAMVGLDGAYLNSLGDEHPGPLSPYDGQPLSIPADEPPVAMSKSQQEISGTIKDQAQDETGTRKLRAVIDDQTLEVYVDGYGNDAVEPGHSSLFALELYEGHLRLLVFGDMHDEAPQVIDLEGASESRRT